MIASKSSHRKFGTCQFQAPLCWRSRSNGSCVDRSDEWSRATHTRHCVNDCHCVYMFVHMNNTPQRKGGEGPGCAHNAISLFAGITSLPEQLLSTPTRTTSSWACSLGKALICPRSKLASATCGGRWTWIRPACPLAPTRPSLTRSRAATRSFQG